MLPTIQQKSSLQPAIYYVVKGRLSYSKATKSEIPFEEKFLHENPILARAKAFSFYQNYASILEEQKQLSCKSLPITILSSDENFGGIVLEKYSNADVRYQNPNEYDKGIAIYMVVQRPMDYMHKTDEIAERFLIHGIWNFDKSDIKNLKNGLIREFGYYQTFKYETNNYAEVIDFSVLEDKKLAFPKSELYSIISTPFSWNFNYYLNENKVQLKKDRRLQNIQSRIQKGTLLNNVFLSSLNHEAIVQEITSLLNENGGFVFLGLNKFRKSVSLFEDKKFNDFKSEISAILHKEFKDTSKEMKLCVYKIGGNVVLVFKIPKNYKRGIFIKENYQKVFYRRNEFGSYKYNDPEEIVEYCISRTKNKLTINDILENL